MSDELNFLRWVYRHADAIDSAQRGYRQKLHEWYERETGNKVPADYRDDV